MFNVTGRFIGLNKTPRARPLRWIAAFLRKIPASISASRQIRADLYINAHLRSCDDERLAMMGFAPEEIWNLRKGIDLADIRRRKVPSSCL